MERQKLTAVLIAEFIDNIFIEFSENNIELLHLLRSGTYYGQSPFTLSPMGLAEYMTSTMGQYNMSQFKSHEGYGNIHENLLGEIKLSHYPGEEI